MLKTHIFKSSNNILHIIESFSLACVSLRFRGAVIIASLMSVCLCCPRSLFLFYLSIYVYDPPRLLLIMRFVVFVVVVCVCVGGVNPSARHFGKMDRKTHSYVCIFRFCIYIFRYAYIFMDVIVFFFLILLIVRKVCVRIFFIATHVIIFFGFSI